MKIYKIIVFENHVKLFKQWFFNSKMDEEKKEEERDYKELVEENKKPAEDNYKTPEEVLKEPSKPNPSLTDKLRKNPFIVSTIVFGILALILLVGMSSGGITGNVVSEEEAGNNVVEFLNTVADSEVDLIDVETQGDFYKVTIGFKGDELPVYVTKDGEYYTSSLIPLSAPTDTLPQNTPSEPAQTQTSYTSEDLGKIKEFSQCLADNGVKAYGAGWCGYCKQFKESFGGVEQITPFYYECQNEDRTPTENAALCEQEQIRGFPTIKINGEVYSGARTIGGLASAIEACDAPELSEGTQQA